MNIRHSTSLIAMAALLGATGFAMAETSTSTFDASVSVLSPDETGFLIGGQVSVGGVGSGALTLSRSAAAMSLNGGASSQLDQSGFNGILDGVTSTADITSSLSFDRQITTSGALVGLGSVISRGEAIAALGSAGAASANTTTAGTRAANFYGNADEGGEGSATAEASAQGSLNGSLSTSNNLQLLGTSGLFAGSNGLTVGENNTALAYGSANILADGSTGIDLTTAAVNGGGLSGTGNGGLFNITSDLTGNNNSIAMSVSNAGNGTISISTSTGGFFTGGGAAAGSSSLADSASYFDVP